MDEIFFKDYKKNQITEEGVPGVQMNAPITANTLPGDIGIELEMEAKNRLPRDGALEHVRSPQTNAQWVGHNDGSLRGEAIEYVLSTPILVTEVDDMVDGVYEAIRANRTVLDCSNRTSTHCHINMRGQTINTITSAIALWATFEDAIVQWCGEERQTNHFCLGMKDSLSTVIAWENYLRHGQLPGRSGRELKYAALNILPLFDRGSLEFRCGPVPSDREKVKAYVHLCHNLCQYAFKTYKNPQQLSYDLSEKGGREILATAIGTGQTFEELSALLDGETAITGFRRVQGLLMGHPWGQWLDLINREYVPNPFGTKKRARQAPRFDEVAPAILGQPIPRREGIRDGDLARDGLNSHFVREDGRWMPAAGPLPDLARPIPGSQFFRLDQDEADPPMAVDALRAAMENIQDRNRVNEIIARENARVRARAIPIDPEVVWGEPAPFFNQIPR